MIFRAICSLVFLGWLLSSTLWSLHSVAHVHEHAVDHGAALEADPCHRSVYHFEKHCDSHEHFSPHQKECSLCAITIHSSYFTLPEFEEYVEICSVQELSSMVLTGPFVAERDIENGRGPPLLNLL